jgi:LPXTG-site transpeptidase (sortase) family protein
MMKLSTLIKSLFLLVFCLGVLGVEYYYVLLPQLVVNKQTAIAPDNLFGWKYPSVKFPITGPGQIAYSDIRDPGGIPQGLPVRLKIPNIGVSSAVEDALITPDGRMDVPQGSKNVAWFSLGPHPGQEGSAVIGGHFGINAGVKFVFYDLDKLKVGDKVYIEDDRDVTLAFQVRAIKLFERDADATTVFTSNDGLAHLNLITCEGVWNKVNDTYPLRRVVFTDAIPYLPATALPSPTPTPPTPGTPPTPPIVAPATPTPTPDTPTPTPTPTTNQQVVGSSISENITRYVKNLYDTPVNGIISSLLLLSIIFVAYKIIRK